LFSLGVRRQTFAATETQGREDKAEVQMGNWPQGGRSSKRSNVGDEFN
jgi:hypothetical protein